MKIGRRLRDSEMSAVRAALLHLVDKHGSQVGVERATGLPNTTTSTLLQGKRCGLGTARRVAIALGLRNVTQLWKWEPTAFVPPIVAAQAEPTADTPPPPTPPLPAVRRTVYLVCNGVTTGDHGANMRVYADAAAAVRYGNELSYAVREMEVYS